MNIIEYITRNEFLKKLYPNGIPNKLIIGRIDLLDEDRIHLCFKTDQKPDIDVAKWGEWNKDYNIVSIELICQFIDNTNIANWKGTRDYFDFQFIKKNDFLNIHLINSESRVQLSFRGIVFQGCSVFLVQD